MKMLRRDWKMIKNTQIISKYLRGKAHRNFKKVGRISSFDVLANAGEREGHTHFKHSCSKYILFNIYTEQKFIFIEYTA